MTSVEQPSGEVTLVFSDIEGSTKLLEDLGTDAYREALAEHRRIVREAYGRHAGYEVDYEGDAFFYAFKSAKDAVSAVGEAMERLEEGPIKIRVGIHTGEPGLDPPKYVGMDVHFAARVMSSAHGGQVVCSASTARLIDHELADLGEHRLKDVAAAVPLYQLGKGSFPPLKTISNTNLPRPASSFVGREQELGEVLARIEGGARLLTLTGPGGSGKTRLALEAAATLVPEYKAGVFWVGLAALRDPALVTETIAQTLGAKDGLAEHIGERELLLLLDNLEQVIDAAPELSALVSSCPNLTVLVTSRELLRVQGEVEYEVPPLAEPEAVDLFCVRSRLEKSEEVAALCACLDNLPLAVELAAARTKSLTPAQILERLAQRLDLLKGGRDADPRQQTLRATIEWSYDLLTPAEQRLFARLSVFAGGCTLEAAQEVADADVDLLQSLVEKSLLRFTNKRYWMLETIRGFATDELDRMGERDALMARHAHAFLGWAEHAREGLKGDDEERWLRECGQEESNVRSALSFLHESGDVGSLLELAGRLGNYWEIRGQWREGRRWMAAAIDGSEDEQSARRARALGFAGMFARHLGDLAAARESGERGLAIYRAIDDSVGATWLLMNLSSVAADCGDLEEAQWHVENALELVDASGDEWGLAGCRGHLADFALRLGDDARAVQLADLALDYYRVQGWSAGIAWCLYLRALGLFRLGHTNQARAPAVEGLRLARAIGDAETEVWLLVLLAARSARIGYRAGAVVLGGADAIRRSVDLVLTGVEAELYSDTVSRLRALLGEAQYQTLYEDGLALSQDDAVEVVLASID